MPARVTINGRIALTEDDLKGSLLGAALAEYLKSGEAIEVIPILGVAYAAWNVEVA